MNKFRFLLTCSNEQDDLIKNINTSQEDGDVFDKWRIPRSSNSSQINCAHTKLTSVFCTSVLDSSSFPSVRLHGRSREQGKVCAPNRFNRFGLSQEQLEKSLPPPIEFKPDKGGGKRSQVCNYHYC